MNQKKHGFKDYAEGEVNTDILGRIRVLSYQGLTGFLYKTGFRNIKLATSGYLSFYGKISDLFCRIDNRHGHFLASSAFK